MSVLATLAWHMVLYRLRRSVEVYGLDTLNCTLYGVDIAYLDSGDN